MEYHNEKILNKFREFVGNEKLLAEKIMNKKRHLALRQDILHKLVISVVRNHQETNFSIKFNDEIKLQCFLITDDGLNIRNFDYNALGFTINYNEGPTFEFTPEVNGNGAVHYFVKSGFSLDKFAEHTLLSWAQDNNGGHWYLNAKIKGIVSMPFCSDAVTILLARLYHGD